MPERVQLSETAARRLAVSCQHLAGPRATPDVVGIKHVLGTLRCLQLDPVSAVAQSHLLVLWSRLGNYDRAAVDTLLWEERWLFEYWAHSASIVLTEDYPVHHAMMRRYPRSSSPEAQRIRAWQVANEGLRAHILERLAESGTLPASGFDDVTAVPWESSGWTSGRNVERMLQMLWLQGEVTVAGRSGRARQWALSAHHLPEALIEMATAPPLTDPEVVALAAEHALRALGVARLSDISQHFIRERYYGLDVAMKELESAGRVLRAEVGDTGSTEQWYVHADSLPLLEHCLPLLEHGEPRTTLLSPFDNLICNRERTERLWGFTFRNEMYVPKAKRQYGYYVLPVLHADRLTGRIALRLDRQRHVLQVEGIYAEPDAPSDNEAIEGINSSLADLAAFTAAREIAHTGPVPDQWRKGLRR
jgi:uncharacterized protein YcaQ